MKKVMDVREAIDLINDGDTVAISGFMMATSARELHVALGEKFLETSSPRNLTFIQGAGVGNNDDHCVAEMTYEGLVKRYITAHFANNKKMVELTNQNKVEAYNFPQGVIAKLFRSIAANQVGELTKIGLNTYCDPRLQGGKMNSITNEDLVELVEINKEEYLLYKSFPIDIALIRGTTADEHGNITMEEESAHISALDIAKAVKASGGKVIVQVKNLVASESIDRTKVVIPGIMVDSIVVCSDPDKYHRQTPGTFYSPIISGQNRAIIEEDNIKKDKTINHRTLIARRCACELSEESVVNLGIGIPEGVADVAKDEGIGDDLILTIESGLIGGTPLGGSDFGSAVNSWAALPMADQFDFYNGGGLDVTFLGFAEVDPTGNINVSKFGDLIAGCGGFIDLTQSTENIVFCGTFTAGGLRTEIKDGQIKILKEGAKKKFVKQIDQITFSSKFGLDNDQNIIFVTERCVFRLVEEGLELIEIAAGIDLEKDILNQMDFEPIINLPIKTMNPDLFKNEKFGLKNIIKSNK